MPRSAAAEDQHLGARRERREQRERPECGGADEQQLAAADPVAERAHRDEEARDHEAVDVDDPEQLGAARLEVLADRRDGEVQDREVHHVEQAGEREDGEADPLAAAGQSDLRVGHRRAPGRCSPVRPTSRPGLIGGATDEFSPPGLSYPIGAGGTVSLAPPPHPRGQKGPRPLAKASASRPSTPARRPVEQRDAVLLIADAADPSLTSSLCGCRARDPRGRRAGAPRLRRACDPRPGPHRPGCAGAPDPPGETARG